MLCVDSKQAVVLPDGIWLPTSLSLREACNFVKWKELVKKKENYYAFGEIEQGWLQYGHVIIIELMVR